MTNWADDVIEEEAEEGDEYRSDGDVLGEVTGKARRRIPQDNAIPYEEQWETDIDAYQALKVRCQLFGLCTRLVHWHDPYLRAQDTSSNDTISPSRPDAPRLD